jgi:hypothetical protein
MVVLFRKNAEVFSKNRNLKKSTVYLTRGKDIIYGVILEGLKSNRTLQTPFRVIKMARIADLAFLPSVATFATTILNNVQNLSRREYCTIVFFSVTLGAVLYNQQCHNHELMMQHDHNFKYLQGQYNERFELIELKRRFEVDIRQVIKNDPEQFWFDVEPTIEKYGTYIDLSDFVGAKGLGHAQMLYNTE